ncbi:MAG: hypothetical protein Q7S61_04605 [bacterium]|nr:hypothetical protein [bacterium]
MNQALFLDQIKNTPYITKQNLGLILEKTGDNLNYWVKKLVNEGTFIVIKNGLYIPKYYFDIVSAANPQEKEAYLIYLANTIRQPSYVSLEYVLAKYNFLAESSFAITSITLKSTRSYTTDIGTFYYQHLKKELFYKYKIEAFRDKQIREASFAKALFDFLYLRSFDSQTEMRDYLLSTGRLNWDIVSKAQKSEFAEIIKTSQSQKMQSLLSILESVNIL